MDTVLTFSLTINETAKWLSSLPILMQESFWWWQCSDRYIISLFPHLNSPVPNKPYGFCGRKAPWKKSGQTSLDLMVTVRTYFAFSVYSRAKTSPLTLLAWLSQRERISHTQYIHMQRPPRCFCWLDCHNENMSICSLSTLDCSRLCLLEGQNFQDSINISTIKVK